MRRPFLSPNRRVPVVLAVVFAVGCSPAEQLATTTTSTPQVTSTSLATTTTSTLAASTTTTTLPPTTTTTLLEGNWAEQPVIASGSWVGVLGWWDGEGWVSPSEEVGIPLRGDEDFQTVGATTYGRAAGDGLQATCQWIRPWDQLLFLDDPGFIFTEAQGEDYEGVVVSAPWEIQPRPIVAIPQDAQHTGFAADVLADLNLPVEEPLISQILSVDLDGDEVLEKLIVAQDAEITFEPVETAYSVVFIRRLVDGEVETTVVAENVVAPGTDGYGEHMAVSGVADLNGDGQMEVVVSSHAWESNGIAIYELQEGGLHRVLSSGCGV